MFKILLISVIAVTLAQDGRWEGGLKVNGRVGQGTRERHRTDQRQVSPENVGGFQNGNFAYTDGVLKTNLNSSQSVKERKNFRPREDTYLHEGAAFRRPGTGQTDVHSSRGRGEVSHEVAEPDEYGLNSNAQENQRTYNTNDQRDEQRNQNVDYNAQSTNRGEGNINRFNTQSTQINRPDDQSANTDQYSVQKDQNSEYANRELGNNQNSQPGRGQNTQQINNQRSESRRGSSETNERHITTNNYDREAMDREMSNQISSMYFKESTEPASGGSRTTSNEARNGTKGQGDRWIWEGEGEGQSTTPGVDHRASFVGDQCPTGQVKFNKVCVDVD